MHPYLAKESYTLPRILALHHAFATRSGGRILHAQTYPLQEVDAEEGDGRLIRGGRLIRTTTVITDSNMHSLDQSCPKCCTFV